MNGREKIVCNYRVSFCDRFIILSPISRPRRNSRFLSTQRKRKCKITCVIVWWNETVVIIECFFIITKIVQKTGVLPWGKLSLISSFVTHFQASIKGAILHYIMENEWSRLFSGFYTR
jgi:hypothetical protein